MKSVKVFFRIDTKLNLKYNKSELRIMKIKIFNFKNMNLQKQQSRTPRTNPKTISVDNPLEFKIKLTPEQLWQAYQKLLEERGVEELEDSDWINKPEVLKMIKEEGKKARTEYEKGQCLTLEELQKEI